MTISSTKNNSAPPLPPRNPTTQATPTHAWQGVPTQTAGTPGHFHTPPPPPPQDTFTAPSPAMTQQARPQGVQGQGHVAASSPLQQAAHVALAPDRATAVTNYANQMQGMLLGNISEGVKAGRISQEALGPLMQDALTLNQEVNAAKGKQQLLQSDANHLSTLLVSQQSAIANARQKSGMASFFGSYFKKPAEGQQELAHQLKQLGEKAQGGHDIGEDLLKLAEGRSWGVQSNTAAAHASPAATAQTAGTSASARPPEPTIEQMKELMSPIETLLNKTGGLMLSPLNLITYQAPTWMLPCLKEQHDAMMSKLEEGKNNGRVSPESAQAMERGLEKMLESINNASSNGQISVGTTLNLARMSISLIQQLKDSFNQPLRAPERWDS
ncbi:MAG: hypothetical protein ABW123_18390 [Cystobacter sp.]